MLSKTLRVDGCLIDLTLTSFINSCVVNRIRRNLGLVYLVLVLLFWIGFLRRFLVSGRNSLQYRLCFAADSLYIALLELVLFCLILVGPSVLAHVVILESSLGPVVPRGR